MSKLPRLRLKGKGKRARQQEESGKGACLMSQKEQQQEAEKQDKKEQQEDDKADAIKLTVIYANSSFSPSKMELHPTGKISINGQEPHGYWLVHEDDSMTVAWNYHPDASSHVVRARRYVLVMGHHCWQSYTQGKDSACATVLVAHSENDGMALRIKGSQMRDAAAAASGRE